MKGATPVVKATGARFGFNMLSAVSAQGLCRFMLVEGRVTATVFCAFLRRLLHGMTRKIVLIVDGHPAHKAKRVQQFVAQQAGQVELHFLPPYSPDLNPDELAWAHVKTKLGRGAARTKVELKRRAGSGNGRPRSPAESAAPDGYGITASASISTSISGEMRRLTSTMLVAGRTWPRNSAWARPTSSQRSMSVT